MSKSRSRTAAATPVALPPNARGKDAPRTSVLYVVRESAQHDRVLFDAMRERTYAAHTSDPAVAAIIGAGLQPLSGERSFTVQRPTPVGDAKADVVYVETLWRGATRAALFEYAGTWHLWSMASAAKIDEAGNNEFTEILGAVIQRLRPTRVVAANFSRLIRSQQQGARLQTYLQGNVDRVVAGSITFELTGPGEKVGWMMFSMFALIASMERDWITARLQAGRVAVWRRGQWTLGSILVPFGYRLDAKTQCLVPILELRPQVEEMLRILGTQMPARAMVDALSSAGVTYRHGRKGRTARSIGKARNAKAMVASLYGSMSIWLDGEYLLRLANTAADVTNVSGAPVVRDGDDDEFGEFQMLHKVALPEGGWAPLDVLAAARAETLRRASRQSRHAPRPLAPEVREASARCDLLEVPTRGLEISPENEIEAVLVAPVSGRRTSSLLTGHAWVEGDDVYLLRTADDTTYALVRGLVRQVGDLVSVGSAQ